MIRRVGLLAALILIVLPALLVPACSGKIATNLPEPGYAGQITENVLLAINSGDYSAFSRDFDISLLKALPEVTFPRQFSEGIRAKIGDYEPVSKRFFQASSQAQYSTVIYYAVYTREEGAVLVQISFKSEAGKFRVSGLLFNSPKLRS